METSVAPVMIENGRRREATTTSEVLLRRKKPSKGGWNAAIFIVCKLFVPSFLAFRSFLMDFQIFLFILFHFLR